MDLSIEKYAQYNSKRKFYIPANSARFRLREAKLLLLVLMSDWSQFLLDIADVMRDTKDAISAAGGNPTNLTS